jgi:hypothetical protein
MYCIIRFTDVEAGKTRDTTELPMLPEPLLHASK